MPTVVSTVMMSNSTMIPTMTVVVIEPMPIPAAAIIARNEAEINRRRFDYNWRLGIIDLWGITGRRSHRINRWCLPANNDTREGRQRERQPYSNVKAHSGLRSRNGSEENC